MKRSIRRSGSPKSSEHQGKPTFGMASLLAELTDRGVVDPQTADWARAYAFEQGIPLDTALLELDLIDEQGLLAALGTSAGLTAASLEDLSRIDPGVSRRLPQGFSHSFGMCPLTLDGQRLTALVAASLPSDSLQELRDLFGLRPCQLIAPAHYLAIARSRVYGAALEPRTERLEQALQRHRDSGPVGAVLERLAEAPTFSGAAAEVLGFAASLVEFVCLLSPRETGLRVVAARGGSIEPGEQVRLPGSGCTLGAALRHGGYFLGPLANSAADREFTAALKRPFPRLAFVAPVTTARGVAALLFADNGPRGMAQRWVAELTLLVARLGQRANRELMTRDQPAPDPEEAPAAPIPSPSLAQAPLAEAAAVARAIPTAAPSVEGQKRPEEATSGVTTEGAFGVTEAERRVLERLRVSAASTGLSVEELVERLLERPFARSEAHPAGEIVLEVRGLFEKLATDIPTHLARGMEAAFRDLVPRVASPPPAPVPSPSPSGSPVAPARAAPQIEVLEKPLAPREVGDYRDKRRKGARVRL